MLELRDVHAFYDKSHILTGVSLEVGAGELVTLLGRNGAGKSTTLKAILGVVPPRRGTVRFAGELVSGLEPFAIARRGLCLVPEGRDVFAILTVEENLRVAQRRGSPWTIADVFRMFPRSMLLLDEPTEGLAPVIVQEIVATLRDLRRSGIPVLLVEQNLRVCEQLADRHYVLEQGRIVYTGTQAEFAAASAVKDCYLALDARGEARG